VHLKTWSFEGVLAAIIALLTTYYVLEPAAFALQYAALLGWSAIVGVLILVIQGLWKTRAYLNNLASRRDSGVGSYERAVNYWGGVHIALSIVVTIFVVIHGVFFLQSLVYPSVAIWLGAVAFVVLIGVSLSGLLTESRRKSRQFGRFKRLHVTLMLTVLALTLIHVEGIISGLFVRSILSGTIIGFVGALVVVIIVTLTDGLDSHSWRSLSKTNPAPSRHGSG
jgi:hypothetical protein